MGQLKTGLWNKLSKEGKTYANGKIKVEDKEYRVVLFLNNNKTSEKSPDFNLILEPIESKKEEQTTGGVPDKQELFDNTQIFEDFGKEISSEITDNDIAF